MKYGVNVIYGVEASPETIEFDASDGIEVLLVQVKCLIGLDVDLTVKLIDYCGREISCLEDLEDICSLDSNDAKESLFVTLWLLNMSSLTFCTEILFHSSPVIQPCKQMIDTEFKLCTYHCSLLSNDLIGAHYESLHCFTCDGQKLEELGLLPSKKEVPPHAIAFFPQPIALYFSRHFLAESLSLQALNLKRSAEMEAREAAFLNRLDSGCKTVSVYEDPLQQYSARNIIPYALIHSYAVEYLTEFPNTAEDEACLRGLLRWFKNDFFKWCNQPACCNTSCASGANAMESVEVRRPPLEEQREGWAGRIEVFRCRECSTTTNFPRYNNPSHLLTTKLGRCGEWANAFGLICRSLALDTRYVLDFTDHVWTEVWVPSLHRFVHLDSCEAAFNVPLLYEAGWGKKLTHIISFSRYGVVDASPRYTRQLNEVIMRRSQDNAAESFISDAVAKRDAEIEAQFLRSRQHLELQGLPNCDIEPLRLENFLKGKKYFDEIFTEDLNRAQLMRRKRGLTRELEGMRFLEPQDLKLEELRGRISGDMVWRSARGELGNEKE